MSIDKKKIGVSMRMVSSDYGEWRDALSHDLIRYVSDQGFEPVLIPNSPETCAIYIRDVVMLILSGGDNQVLKSDSEQSDDPRSIRDRTEIRLLQAAIRNNTPVLGVCRGAQLINTYFGGSCGDMPPGKQHVAIDHEIRLISEQLRSIFESKERMTVNSYHSLGIKSLGKDIVPSAISTDDEIEAIEHIELPIMGVMWHPERTCSNEDFKGLHSHFLSDIIDNYPSKS